MSTLNWRDGYADEFEDHGVRTWYRVTVPAPAAPPKPPVIILHGGPGAGHDYLLEYAALARAGYPVIHYDQVGCGRSTHFPRADASFFTVDLFTRQLDSLISHLGLLDYILLGHSWGGMLAVEHALTQPAGLRGMVLASSTPSIPLWRAEAERLWQALPDWAARALDSAKREGVYTAPRCQEAINLYYARHVSDFTIEPDDLHSSTVESQSDGHTYNVMWGPYECYPTGSLRSWDRISELPQIQPPVLVTRGEHDQSTATVNAPFLDALPNVHAVVVPDAKHVPHLENPQPALRAVREFLATLTRPE